ncbi:MAG TPA: TIM barrel protein [Luteitalea sp.]|nr:TIM barrel protein [Luteitalea sp.]
MIRRREFLGVLASVPVAAAAQTGSDVGRTSMLLAYTSFAVRMAQGRDLLRANVSALGPDTFRELCARFATRGGQMDLSQVSQADQAKLTGVREAFTKDGLELEVSIPSRFLETPESYAQAVGVARALGATRGRVALLSGRRYESFETADVWHAFRTKWHDTLRRMRPEFDRHAFPIGIENHKDWLAADLAALLETIGSSHVGACVDFGNNLALLEDPDETIRVLAPFAVTTHLKDMALRRTDEGFELSEVPLGQGMLPIQSYVDQIRKARPEARMCLEMITRDPLKVPYRTDRYWVAFSATDRRPERLKAFEARVLSKAVETLPRVSGLSPADQITAEDDNVRACVAYARATLRLGANRA